MIANRVARGGRATRVLANTRAGWAPLSIGALATLTYRLPHMGYDASWSLLWGRQLAAGRAPAFEAAGAPTPHPLANLVSTLLAPLDGTAALAVELLSAVTFGILVWAAYLFGARLFGRSIAALFAAIVFTRPALVNLHGQALIDIPFLACVMSAAALEAERRRRGVPVLALLTLAGLLRPEGWLLASAYALYVLAGRGAAGKARVMALAVSAPCVWALFDLLVTGDPLHSLHRTQGLAEDLDRPRTLGAALDHAPDAMAHLVGMPVVGGGLAGLLAAALALRGRARIPSALAGLGLTSFLVLGIAGLPVLDRYLVLPSLMLALFAAVALLGWRLLDRADRRRAPWIATAALVAGLLVLGVSSESQELRRVTGFLDQRRAIEHDLRTLSTAAAWDRSIGRTVHVSTARAVPLLAAWLDGRVRVSAAPPPPGARVLAVRHANERVAAIYALSVRPWSLPTDVAWRLLYRNRSWALYESTRPAATPASLPRPPAAARHARAQRTARYR